MPPGTLFVVATPIGNLEDMTFRAVRVLGEVDAIACEDTRHSRTLLDHYGIRRPTLSYHRLNEAQRGGEVLELLLAGKSLALISDAGAPLLSDPGARLVARAVDAGIAIVPVPGASAPMTALMAGGGSSGPQSADETPAICFLGFLPSRAGKRCRRLSEWAQWPGILILFESPHRVLAALEDMEHLLGGGRSLLAGREMTKLHEEFLRGTIASVRRQMEGSAPRGEFTLVVGPPPEPIRLNPALTPPANVPLPELTVDMSKQDLKRLARSSGCGRRELYRRQQQLRGKIDS